MTKFRCPMHPEVEQTKPGRCPKCGMNLELAGQPVKEAATNNANFRPLIVIVGLIFLVAVLAATQGNFDWRTVVSNFMIGFFVVFAGFKLIDLAGFAQGYSTYDLLAQRWFGYGYVYPFIELGFGIAMLLNWQTQNVLYLEILVMTFSGLGVLLKLLKHQPFQCACLGTAFKLPLTYVTLVEDFGMAGLALLLLLT